MKLLPIHRKWIAIIVLLVALGSATPVLADYLGPNRTETVTVETCTMVLYECKPEGSGWDYKRTEDWSCPTGHDACEGGGGACNASDHTGSYCKREYGTKEVITTHPSATIEGTLENCTAPNGWCITPPTLVLEAREPLFASRDKVIMLIEGFFNGVAFACTEAPGEVMTCSLGLQEGDNNFEYWALSSWGDSSEKGFSSAKVDTVPPEVSLGISGTPGNNGWYRSAVQVSATPSDATSGVATFEVAVDGGAYQTYTTAIPFTDGRHILQFKAVDVAGNVFETLVQNFDVDTIPPTVDVRAGWQLGKDVSYRVDDGGSGLEALRIVIEDEDEKFAKMTWDRDASGASYSSHLDWNGEFKDETVAPPGSYLAWFKARDVAGNERIQFSRIVVPEPNISLSVLPTEDPIATDLPVPPAELSPLVEQPPATVPPVLASEGGTTESTTQTVLLSSGTAPAASTSSPGILWGGAAAAAIAAATAYALEATRKRKEAEEAQAAAVRAEIAADKKRQAEKGLTKEEKKELKAEQARAHDAKVQERKERQEWANLSVEEKAQLKWEEERDAAYAQQVWVAWQEEQRRQQELREQMAEKLTKFEEKQDAEWEAQQEALREQREAERLERKLEQLEAEDAKWVAAQTAIEKKENTRTVVVAPPKADDPPPPRELTWWEKLKVKVEQTKQKVETKVEDAKQWVNTKVEQAKTKYEEVKTTVKQKVEDAKQWVNTKVEQAKTKYEEVKTTVKQKVEDAKQWVNTKVEQAKTKYEEVKTTVKQKVEDAKQWVNTKVKETKQWAQTKYNEAKESVKQKWEDTKQWALTKIENIKQALKEPYGYLKKSNPPPWLSISGGASAFEKDLFSSDYIGLSSGTGGFWKRFFYEKQTVKYSVSTSGTRNPNGFVEVDVTEGKTSVELGKLTIYGKPLTAEIGFTIKHETKDPNQYTEDVYALDYGWMSSGWITATNKVTIEPSSTSDFEIKTTETVEGKVRKIKGEGPVMIIVGAVVLYYAWPVILPSLPKIKELIPAWN